MYALVQLGGVGFWSCRVSRRVRRHKILLRAIRGEKRRGDLYAYPTGGIQRFQHEFDRSDLIGNELGLSNSRIGSLMGSDSPSPCSNQTLNTVTAMHRRSPFKARSDVLPAFSDLLVDFHQEYVVFPSPRFARDGRIEVPSPTFRALLISAPRKHLCDSEPASTVCFDCGGQKGVFCLSPTTWMRMGLSASSGAVE